MSNINDNFDVNDVITEYETMYKEQTRTAVMLQAQVKALMRTIDQRDALVDDLEKQLKITQDSLNAHLDNSSRMECIEVNGEEIQ